MNENFLTDEDREALEQTRKFKELMDSIPPEKKRKMTNPGKFGLRYEPDLSDEAQRLLNDHDTDDLSIGQKVIAVRRLLEMYASILDRTGHMARRERIYLIFADPPYAINPVPVLREVYDRQVLAPGGVLVLETSKRAVLAAGWPGELEREAVYGETRVCHFRAARVGD